MNKIRCTFDDYDQICDIVGRMYFRANEYTPTMEELRNIVEPRFEKYMLFLIWIDETGETTDLNRGERAEIRRILNRNLVLYDPEDEEEEGTDAE